MEVPGRPRHAQEAARRRLRARRGGASRGGRGEEDPRELPRQRARDQGPAPAAGRARQLPPRGHGGRVAVRGLRQSREDRQVAGLAPPAGDRGAGRPPPGRASRLRGQPQARERLDAAVLRGCCGGAAPGPAGLRTGAGGSLRGGARRRRHRHPCPHRRAARAARRVRVRALARAVCRGAAGAAPAHPEPAAGGGPPALRGAGPRRPLGAGDGSPGPSWNTRSTRASRGSGVNRPGRASRRGFRSRRPRGSRAARRSPGGPRAPRPGPRKRPAPGRSPRRGCGSGRG